METVRVMLLVLLCGGAGAAWWRSRFPGGWAYAFSTGYARDRADLAGARRALREVDKDAGQAEATVREQLRLERAKHGQRVAELEQKVAHLQEPGLGTHLKQFGELTLHEHAVVAVPSNGRPVPVIPLAGLHVRVESGERIHSLYLTHPEAGVHRATYPYRPAPSADAAQSTQLFDEEQVRDFEVEIQNAAVIENRFRSNLAAQLDQVREELAEARQDTGQLDAARQRLAEMIDRNHNNPRRKEALAELEAARDRWQNLTQRRPPR